ncbi:MAG: DUF4270 domain-containing protein [Odoribacter sp.]|nr:DUF4270 domain-containing protein [Odoribacter sp.]
MKSLLLSLIAIAGLTAFVACDDASSVGNVLDNETVVIVIDSNYTVTGTSEANPVVQSRTLSQLLGKIEAPRYGNITSNVVAQFMPSTDIDTAKMTAADIDSVKLFMQMDNDAFVGDSLVPMGLQVYRLTRELPYPIYSNFNPDGYYDPSPIGGAVYTASVLNEPDSVQKRTMKAVIVDLPTSLGREIFDAYKANPATFSNPETFTAEVFQGLYFRSSYGSGRISDFTTTSIRLYYHKTIYNTDSARYETTNYTGDYLAVTPEVIVNNNIKFTPAPELEQMVADGDHILAAPAGYQVEIKFPGRELLEAYNKYQGSLRVLNTLTFEIPADSIANDYSIAPPPYAMLIVKNQLNEFYAANTIPDNVTQFYAPYNTTTRSYNFTAMRGYLLDLLSKEQITDDDLTFLLCPVQVNTETAANTGYGTSSTIVTSVVPYVSKPAMARISLSDAKIKLTFSAQPGKNF